jgi:hypothetical protein
MEFTIGMDCLLPVTHHFLTSFSSSIDTPDFRTFNRQEAGLILPAFLDSSLLFHCKI